MKDKIKSILIKISVIVNIIFGIVISILAFLVLSDNNFNKKIENLEKRRKKNEEAIDNIDYDNINNDGTLK
jgi:hypothetical protein